MADDGASLWNRLKRSVDAAIDAPSNRVSIILRDAVAGSRSVYEAARELLRIRREADRFFDSTPERTPTRRPQHASLTPGTVLAGRYRIDRLLGCGGMGEVYDCFDGDLGEPVGIKILRREIVNDDEFLQQFRAELALGRQIHHPNVCRLYELQSADSLGQPVVFFTMELLNGETLNEALTRGPLSEPEATPLADEIIAGVQAIHDAGILHRDLKCANIMLLPVRADRGARAVVMDFGLAQRFERAETTLSAIQDGSFAGTPAYMSPEQLEGRTLTPASDIHALGVILFRMVTARYPFPGHTSLQIAMHRLNGRARSPRQLNRSISRRWEGAVLACLEPSPSRRPQTANDVADLLHGRKTFRRLRHAAAAAAVVSGLGVVGFAANAYLTRPVAPNQEALRHYQLGQEFVDRRQGEDLRQAVVEFDRAIAIQPSFAPASVGLAEAYSALSNWGLMEPREALARSRAAAERAVQLDSRLASAHAVLGYTISIYVARWREATPHFARALELNPADPKVHLWYAAHLGRLGQSEEAIRQIRAGLQLKPADMLLNHQLATEFFRAKRYTEFYAQAEELVRLQPFQANSHLVRARALESLRRYDDAVAACRTAEKYNLDRAQLVLMLGIIDADRGHSEDARRYADEAEGLPRSRPVDLAGLYARLGLYDRAIVHLRAGLQSGDSSVLSAHVTPYFDDMRSSPPFRDFLREIGVSEIGQNLGLSAVSSVGASSHPIRTGTSYRRPRPSRCQQWRNSGTTTRRTGS